MGTEDRVAFNCAVMIGLGMVLKAVHLLALYRIHYASATPREPITTTSGLPDLSA